MKHRTFFWFFLPTALAMLLFIALPLVSIVVQSFYTDHEQVFKTVKNCGPFGCKEETIIDQEASAALKDESPLGRFAGFQIYKDRGHLAVVEVGNAWRNTETFGAFFSEIKNFPFYRALSFTLTYTFVVTPLLLMDDPNLSLKASTSLMWISLIVYGIWHSAPFAFVVFYAGLQTLPQDTLESAQIDGASRWQQIRYVVIPHMTIIGVAILLTPVLIRTWHDFNAKA